MSNKKGLLFIDTKEVTRKFLNLKNLSFSFSNEGLTIIVGKNNVGKTKLLEYIFLENRKWDGLDDEYEGGYTKYLPIFFGEDFNVCISNHEYYAKLEKKGRIRCEYEVYYFDLEQSFFQLIEKHKTEKEERKEIIFKNGRKRGCWTYYTGENRELWSLKSVVMENEKMEETRPIEPLVLEIKDEEDNFDIDIDNRVGGRDGVAKISHPLSGVGSGLIKTKTLQSLIEKIIDKNKTESSKLDKPIERWNFEEKIYTPILLIDEPELLLHPSLVGEVVGSINQLRKNNITTVLTTHSPAFLSYFIQQEETVNLVIVQKEEGEKKGHLKNPLYLRNFLQDSEIYKKIKGEYEKFAKEKKENIDNPKFYISKWKRLFNQETLRVFFTKKVFFVEGMTDYVLFNNVLKEELNKELKKVEIIPILGKFHYIFFYELAKWLGLDFWFLLDKDKAKDKEGKEYWKEVYRNKEINKIFWEKYGEGKVSEEKSGMMHSKKGEARVSWVCFDLEVFLEIKDDSAKDKEYNLISRADEVLINLKKNNSAKLNELRKIFTDFLKVEEEK